MKKPECPSRLRSKSLRSRWTRVVNDLIRHSLDPVSRAELIADFVELDERMAVLRRDGKGGTVATRLANTRALNVATAERRRLHQRLFAGGKRPEATPLPLDEVVTQIASTDGYVADEAWRAHFRAGKGLRANSGDRTMAARSSAWQRAGDGIEARHGAPSWAALLYETAEAQAEAEAVLDAEYRRRPSAFTRPPAERVATI